MASIPPGPTPGGNKLFPRNLTARADYVVPGNPISSRPESGVDNTHPGLELDVRNIDRFFFPGLCFDFQYRCGARLSGVDRAPMHPDSPLRTSDAEDRSLVLWGICARFGDRPDTMAYVELGSLDGYDVLARIRDLEPKTELAIVISQPVDQLGLRGFQAAAQWMCSLAAERGDAAGYASRDRRSGKLLFAVVTGTRADYLDNEGVIDTAAIEPGVLTQSLCSPWQWDFADCGCYYWAASRPDIVMDHLGGPQTLNYQRRRASTPSPAPPPDQVPLEWEKWIEDQITQPEMLLLWETLPIVNADVECPGGAVNLVTPPSIGPPEHGVDWVIQTLKRLAGVEHAVCLMYLYAAFSVRVPLGGPQDPACDKEQDALRVCAGELFRIAKEEMLHLRWVNDALALVGQGPALERADQFGTPVRNFALRPVTDEVLKEFIDIERPSALAHVPGRTGGMYVELLDEVGRLRERATSPDRDKFERLQEIIKLLIDEGDDHFERFERIKLAWDKIPEPRLRVGRGPYPAGEEPPELTPALDAADASYARLLDCLCRAYKARGPGRTRLVGQAVGAMLELQGHGEALARAGSGMRFTLPPPCPP